MGQPDATCRIFSYRWLSQTRKNAGTPQEILILRVMVGSSRTTKSGDTSREVFSQLISRDRGVEGICDPLGDTSVAFRSCVDRRFLIESAEHLCRHAYSPKNGFQGTRVGQRRFVDCLPQSGEYSVFFWFHCQELDCLSSFRPSQEIVLVHVKGDFSL